MTVVLPAALPPFARRLPRFALVGGVSTLIYAGAVLLLGSALGPVAASVAACGLAAVFSYFGHKRFTFRSGQAHAFEAPRFALVTASALAVSTVVPEIVTRRLGLPSAVSILLVCLAVPAANFLALYAWVFAEERRKAEAGKARQTETSLPWLVALAILCLAVLDKAVFCATHMDVSWLLLVGEKMLDGQRLYSDIWETNPPFSVILYLPFLGLQHFAGGTAEFWTGLGAFLWACGCLWLAVRLALRCADRRCFSPWLVPIGLALAFLALPTTFAQREFFAVFAATPLVLLATLRLDATPARAVVPLGLAILVGTLGSVAMLVKPHYAAAYALPYAFVAWRRRNWRVLFGPEILTAAALVLLYALVLVLAFPEFLHKVLPILADVYVPRRVPWTQMLAGFGLIGLILLAAILVLTPFAGSGQRHLPAGLAFAGFFLAYLVQGKGWDYHALPFVVFGGLSLAMAGFAAWPRLKDHQGTRALGLVALLLPAFFLAQASLTLFTSTRSPAQLAASLEEAGPVRSLGVVGSYIGLGHPLTRMLHAEWRSRDCSDWLGAYAQERLDGAEAASLSPELRERLRSYVAAAVRRKAAELASDPPDVLVIDHAERGWLAQLESDPAFRAAVASYRSIGFADEVEFLRR